MCLKDLDTKWIAPECYYIFKSSGEDGVYREEWLTSGNSLVVEYTQKDVDNEVVKYTRQKTADIHNVKLSVLCAYSVPPSVYEETIAQVKK